MVKKRTYEPDLQELGASLGIVTRVLLDVVSRRNDLSLLVGEHKDLHGQPKIRLDIEDKRLEDIDEYASKIGVDHNFARTLLYMLISESCRVQIAQTENSDVAFENQRLNSNKEEWYTYLRENLLTLTASVAAEYDFLFHEEGMPCALRMYREYEQRRLQHEIDILRDHGACGRAVNLGSATGRICRDLSDHFKSVDGYDVSWDMVANAERLTHSSNVAFIHSDLETGSLQEVEPRSVDLVAMTLGTASDIREIRPMLAGIRRMLSDDGRFLLSFYNRSAALCWWNLPWHLGFHAHMNMDKRYLDVRKNGVSYPVFARAYDSSEVHEILEQAGLEAKKTNLESFPTIGSVLPDALLSQDKVYSEVSALDTQLNGMGRGAYIVVSGRAKKN